LEYSKQDKSLRTRLQDIPELPETGLRDCQILAINKLEQSFKDAKPKALIQMATGSGKTFTAITFIYRLLKFAKAKRILFLVDTKNLGEQAEQEMMAYVPNDDNRKFTELYGITRLKSSFIRPDNQVYISTIQRMQGKTIPKESNHVRLSKDLKDAWGIPQLITAVDYDSNDDKMVADFFTQGTEMLEKAGCKNIVQIDSKQAPGLDIHEMGGVRMGKDPSTSLLNKWNQLHACKNVFVTDGACMTSTGNQNPSITFMALTARAANYAAEEVKKGNL